jgi:hypothetical protein
MDELMKRGGKAKKTMKQKQKQSVVIKNVINIGERKKKMNKRQKRARKQPQDGRQSTGGGGGIGGAFNPVGVQFPYQKLFQAPPNQYRSLTMSSANANEASNNTSDIVDATQKIVYGKIKSDLDDALTFNAYKRIYESKNALPVQSPSSVRVDEVDEGSVDFNRDIIRSNDEYQKLVDEKRKLEQEMKDVVVEDVGEDKQDYLSPLQKEQERILEKAQENIEKKKRITKKDRERMKMEEEETLKELEKAYEETPLSARKKIRKREYNIN